MKRYTVLKGLLKEAYRLMEAYGGEDLSGLTGQPELSIVMARNSFVAHSVYAGHDRVIVERVADYVFPSLIHSN